MSRVGHVKLTFKKGNFRVSSLLPSYSIKWIIQNAHQLATKEHKQDSHYLHFPEKRGLVGVGSLMSPIQMTWIHKKNNDQKCHMCCFVKLFKTRIVTDENKWDNALFALRRKCFSTVSVLSFISVSHVNTAALNMLIHVFSCTITCFLLDKQKWQQAG